MTEKIILRNKKPFNKLLYLIPIVFFPIGKMALENFESDETWRIGLSFLLFLFCGLILLFFLKAIKQSKRTLPALIINDTGITDNISIANVGKIYWDEILRFEILKSAGHPHLFIFVENSKKFLKNKSWFVKGLMTQLNKDKGSPIAIDLNQIKIDSKELLEILEEMKSTHNPI